MRLSVRSIIPMLLIYGMLIGVAFGAPINFKLDHYVINIGAFYNGTTVNIKGQVPSDAEVVIRITGHPEELALKKKGKIGGLLWMNVKDITFYNVPNVYMIYASKGADKWLPDENLPFTFAALKQRVKIEPEDEDKNFLYGEFLKLKRKEHTYAEFASSVQFMNDDGKNKEFEATLSVPPKMKKGEYSVDVFALRNGEIIGNGSTKLKICYVGFPGLLDQLAFQHSLIYGILAVLIAIGAGLVIGAIFKDKGGSH